MEVSWSELSLLWAKPEGDSVDMDVEGGVRSYMYAAPADCRSKTLGDTRILCSQSCLIMVACIMLS